MVKNLKALYLQDQHMISMIYEDQSVNVKTRCIDGGGDGVVTELD